MEKDENRQEPEKTVVSAELLEEDYQKRTVLASGDLKKNKKGGKGPKIIIAAVIAALVLGGFVLSKVLIKPDENEAEVKPSATPDLRVQLLDRKLSDFDYVTITQRGGDKYTIDSHALLDDKGNIIGYESGATAAYELVGQPSFLVDPKQGYDLTKYSAALVAKQLVEEKVTDLSGYGLADPACRAEIHYRDGSQVTLLFGDPVPTMSDSYYYITMEGSGAVYMGYATHYNVFNSSKNARHTVPTNTGLTSADNVQSLLVKRPGQEPLEITRKEVDESYLTVSTMQMVQPFVNDASLQTGGELFEAAIGIQLDLYAGTLEEVADVSGLGEDQATLVRVTDKNGNLLQYLVGNVAEDGEHTYVCINDTAAFLAKASTVDFVRNCTPQYVIDRFSGIVYIDRVNKVTVEAGGESYELAIERTLDGETEVSKYFFDGGSIDDKTFKKLYQAVIASMVSKVSDDFHLTGDTVLTIRYELNVEPGAYVVEFITYNDDYYAVRRADGLTVYLIKKTQVQAIEDAMVSMRAGTFAAE